MVKCAKCGSELEELEEDYDQMSDAQMSDYEAGLWRTCYCPKCKTTDVIEGQFPTPYIPGEDDMMDDEINYEYFEDLIERAIDKRCFIEVISLIHNAIEFELYILLEDHIEKINSVTVKQDDKKKPIDEAKSAEIKAKIKLLQGNRNLKYLKDYCELCFMLDLITAEQYKEITQFNEKRNAAIHKLIKKNSDDSESSRYREIIENAKLGRKIQLELSDYDAEMIKTLLTKFNIKIEESYSDPFLTKD